MRFRNKRPGKNWLLFSDHPKWKALPWPIETKIIGEVKWSAMEL